MHIPARAFEWLYTCPDLNHDEKSVFSAIAYLRPGNLAELSAKTGLGRPTVVRACRALVDKGWLRLIRVKTNHLKPTCWIPAEYQRKLAAELESEYKMAPLGGEFLLGRLLEFWVDVIRFVNNARPEFLTNPLTGEPLELDRYIPGLAGFEYNGTQHYAATEKYNSKKELNETKARDLMKEALCGRNGITLVTVTAADLSIQGIRKLLPPNLPLHDVDLEGPYAAALERLCGAYRKKAPKPQKNTGVTDQTHHAASLD